MNIEKIDEIILWARNQPRWTPKRRRFRRCKPIKQSEPLPEIETGIPYMDYRQPKTRKTAILVGLIRSLNISTGQPTDQSFVWPHGASGAILSTAEYYGLKIKTLKDPNGRGYRIWRIA